MAKDYFEQMPEDFDPLGSYKDNYHSNYDWNFAERDLSDGESPSKLNYEIKRKHPR